MSSKARRIGSEWEVRVRDHWREVRPSVMVHRIAAGGSLDAGDLCADGLMIECKAERKLDLAGYMAEVRRQRDVAGTRWGCVVVKRRNHPVGRAYVVMELDDFIDLHATAVGGEE